MLHGLARDGKLLDDGATFGDLHRHGAQHSAGRDGWSRDFRSHFGDKISPLSDPTNLAAGVAEADLFDHVRSMLYTMGPAVLLSLVINALLGLNFRGGTGRYDSSRCHPPGAQGQLLHFADRPHPAGSRGVPRGDGDRLCGGRAVRHDFPG